MADHNDMKQQAKTMLEDASRVEALSGAIDYLEDLGPKGIESRFISTMRLERDPESAFAGEEDLHPGALTARAEIHNTFDREFEILYWKTLEHAKAELRALCMKHGIETPLKA